MAEKDIEFDTETGEEIVRKQPIKDQDDDHDDHDEHDEHDDDQDSADGADTEGSDEGDDVDSEGEEVDEEREAIRERRRQERKHRKQAQKEREETLRRELSARDAIINELREKVNGIERRNSGSEMAQLEHAKQQTVQAYNYFKDQIRVATEAGNGAGVADATEKMLQAQQRFAEIQNYEKAYRQKAVAPQPLDPRLANHAQSWMEKNKWYDPAGKDPDSRIALTIDQQLADEGWDPTSEAYWSELSERVKKYLPHRVGGAKMNPRRPKPVVSGPAREAVPGKGTYKLSGERVQALKDAGLWEDPKQRAEAIKRFREYDKNNQGKE